MDSREGEAMTIYDLLWKRAEDKNGKARWEKVGVLIEKDGKLSLKLDLIPVSKDWDGWLVVSERKDKDPF
jgi:hypothetical protein